MPEKLKELMIRLFPYDVRVDIIGGSRTYLKLNGNLARGIMYYSVEII
jgi:hypothetical protein